MFARDITNSRARLRTPRKSVNKVILLICKQLRERRPRRNEIQIGLKTARDFFSHLTVRRVWNRELRHPRRYDAGLQLDPLHYLVTLGRRPMALDHADLYRQWQLPAAFNELRRKLEARHGAAAGIRHYIQVLQLLAEHPLPRVRQAVETVLGSASVPCASGRICANSTATMPVMLAASRIQRVPIRFMAKLRCCQLAEFVVDQW